MYIFLPKAEANDVSLQNVPQRKDSNVVTMLSLLRGTSTNK